MSTQMQVSEHRTDHQSPIATADAILRVLGVVGLMGLALVHIVQLVPTFQTMQPLGVGYLLLIAGTVVVGARLIIGAPTRTQLWAPVAILGLGALVAYAFTRVVSTPLDNQDVGNWACTLGMAALFIEAGLIALSAYAITTRSRARQALLASRFRSMFATSNE
jgi:FtsH-binding integral membrane protein